MENDGDRIHFLSKADKSSKDSIVQVYKHMTLHILTRIYNTYIIILKNKIDGDKQSNKTKKSWPKIQIWLSSFSFLLTLKAFELEWFTSFKNKFKGSYIDEYLLH